MNGWLKGINEMNEWINQWMHEWMTEWMEMNECMNGMKWMDWL